MCALGHCHVTRWSSSLPSASSQKAEGLVPTLTGIWNSCTFVSQPWQSYHFQLKRTGPKKDAATSRLHCSYGDLMVMSSVVLCKKCWKWNYAQKAPPWFHQTITRILTPAFGRFQMWFCKMKPGFDVFFVGQGFCLATRLRSPNIWRRQEIVATCRTQPVLARSSRSYFSVALGNLPDQFSSHFIFNFGKTSCSW